MERLLMDIFMSVLNMSISGSFVIVGVLLARLLLRRAPKIFSYALWSVVLVRLLFPFSFESVLSLIPVKAQTLPPMIVYSPVPRIDSGIAIVDSVVSGVLPAPTVGASVNPLQLLIFSGAVLWLCVAAVMVGYSVVSYLLLKKQVSRALPVTDNVYECESVTSPFVLGLVRPRIYLPMGIYDDEYRYIVGHEQTHIARRDYLVKPLAFMALCLHWFNPLVWLAFLLSAKDMEMSCDEDVIKRFGSSIKPGYSASLLSLAGNRMLINGTPVAFGESNIKSRIKNILRYKKPAVWLVAVAVVFVTAVGCGLLTSPKSESIEPPSQSQTPSSQPQSATVPTESEIKALLDDLLARARNVEALSYDTLAVKAGASPGVTKQQIDTENQPTPELLELARQLKTTDDVRAYVQSVFEPETAETVLSFIFNIRYQLYHDSADGILRDTDITPQGLMLASWKPETMQVISSASESITLEMEIERYRPKLGEATDTRQLTIVNTGEAGWRFTADYVIDRTLLRQQTVPDYAGSDYYRELVARKQELVEVVYERVMQYRKGTPPDNPNHHQQYPDSFPPAGRITPTDSVDKFAIRETRSNLDAMGAVYIAVEIDDDHELRMLINKYLDSNGKEAWGSGDTFFVSAESVQYMDWSLSDIDIHPMVDDKPLPLVDDNIDNILSTELSIKIRISGMPDAEKLAEEKGVQPYLDCFTKFYRWNDEPSPQHMANDEFVKLNYIQPGNVPQKVIPNQSYTIIFEKLEPDSFQIIRHTTDGKSYPLRTYGHDFFMAEQPETDTEYYTIDCHWDNENHVEYLLVVSYVDV